MKMITFPFCSISHNGQSMRCWVSRVYSNLPDCLYTLLFSGPAKAGIKEPGILMLKTVNSNNSNNIKIWYHPYSTRPFNNEIGPWHRNVCQMMIAWKTSNETHSPLYSISMRAVGSLVQVRVLGRRCGTVHCHRGWVCTWLLHSDRKYIPLDF